MLRFRELGISRVQYFKIMDEANVNGSGSVSQDELGAYLMQAVDTGSLTEAQAEAVWQSMQWDKSFKEGMRAAKRKAAAMEQLAANGVSEADYKKALSEADTNGDKSITQKELYSYLNGSDLSQGAKDAFWASQGWTKSIEDVERETLISDMKAAAFFGDTAAYSAALSAYTRTRKAKEAYSAVKGFVRKVYMGDDLSEGEYAIAGGANLTDEQARRMLRSYAGMGVDDAVSTIADWRAEKDFVRKHGDEYEKYGLTVAQAQFYYTTVKRSVSLDTYSAHIDRYGLDRVKAFYGANGWSQTGLTIEQYDSYATEAAKCKGTDNDLDGKTDAYSVMYQKFAVINAMPVSKAIKDAICRKEGWAERNIAKAPWH